MRKTLFKGAFVPFIVVAAIFVSCSDDDFKDKTTPPIWQGATNYADYTIDWTEAADSVSQAFIERFYCDGNRNGSRDVFSYTPYNEKGNNGNSYWQNAHAMTAMIEYYNRIKDSNATEEARIRDYFKRWYDRRGNNYDGANGGSTGFGNVFTDDTCWITITLFKLYEATGEQFYFDAAKTTWDEIIWPRTALNQYGWLPWKLDDLGANECTNGPGAIIAAMLAQYSKDAGDTAASETYLNQAYKLFDQNIDVMRADGTLGTTPLSYTQGTCMEAGRLIWKLSGDRAYGLKAVQAARGQMSAGSMNSLVKLDGYAKEYVVRNEGDDGNNTIFAAVMFHWAIRMIMDPEIDKIDPKVRADLQRYLLRHASYYWTLGIRKAQWDNAYFSPSCLEPFQYGVFNDDGMMGCFTSATQVIEGMCILEKAQF